jgi:predicted DNA-binding transcriptional regulator AlpA
VKADVICYEMATDLPTRPDLSPEVLALKRQVTSLLALLSQNDSGGHAFSIAQFCARNNISRSFFYKLRKAGKAPRTMRVGGRQIVSPDAEREWRCEREAERGTDNV